MSTGRTLLWKLHLVVASTLLALLMIEVGLRVASYVHDVRQRKALHSLDRQPPIRDFREVVLGEILRPSENLDIIYELKPDLRVKFGGRVVRTNSEGFCSPSFEPTKADDTVRIVGLGDSVMFGWGVEYEHSYLSVLSDSLNAGTPGLSWEIVNTSVPGYNAAMEVETLFEKALGYEPDIVVIHFVDNDINLPNFIRKEGNYLSLRRSFLFDHLARRFERRRPDVLVGLQPAPFDESGFLREGDPARVPQAYRHMVGVDGYRIAMQRLAAASEERNFEVVLLGLAPPGFVRQICAELNVPIVDIAPKWTAFLQANGIADWRRSALVLHPTDPHPSALGHRLIANALLEHFSRSGLIARMSRPDVLDR